MIICVVGLLYESTGLYKESSIQILHPDTGAVIKKVSLPDKYFGEGLAVFMNLIYVLTWQEKEMLIYNSETLQFVNKIDFKTSSSEGWGLTVVSNHDGSLPYLLASDGSNILTVWTLPTVANNMQLEKVLNL